MAYYPTTLPPAQRDAHDEEVVMSYLETYPGRQTQFVVEDLIEDMPAERVDAALCRLVDTKLVHSGFGSSQQVLWYPTADEGES